VYDWLMAIAAIAFIGCTGNGIPNATPVAIFAIPEKTKVADKDMLFVKVRAMSKGSKVPRSPRAPESSFSG
jgi:hypothetical protein